MKKAMIITAWNYFRFKVTTAQPTAPSLITDLNATDNQISQVIITFSNATGTQPITYDLYENGINVASNISSGYVRSVSAGTYDYYVVAVNSVGSAQSNTDSGTSLLL